MAKFITSAGDICEPYETLDLITAHKGGEGSFDYQAALALLVEHAKKMALMALFMFNSMSAPP